MSNITEIFGTNVFGDEEMAKRLPADIYKSLKEAISDGKAIDRHIADTVAEAMKNWAVEHGATHFTHWFQPMTGITAEKHDSFIEPAENGKVILSFSGKNLIKGEPDASSFPSGGLRATFEARGYTAWDPSSYAFIKDKTLCIPTAFCSYNGEALDEKTPLLRSMEAINREALKIAKLLCGDDVTKINVSVGSEQEYFLVDKAVASTRPDIVFCGRTLMGAKPPKGQEMNDHYFGVIKPRVAAFMADLDDELWKLGVYAKTEHNEVAPAQHELAPVFTTANIATDHNQLTMELMKKVADRHGLRCLLHEKPFAGVNGSGKHNNWSIATNTGINFFKPGKNPEENKLFLLSIAAFIKAIDEHQDLIRYSTASAGNDQRLGGHEAPPAIISIYLGDALSSVFYDIANGEHHESGGKIKMNIGAEVIPYIKKDTSDRNRTSPIAFTGNKFEFRMPGSSDSIAGINTVINTIIADVFSEYAKRLEAADNIEKEILGIVKEAYNEHKRILFDGDGYSDEWKDEAKRRGLLNLPSTPEAIPYFAKEENIALFEKHGVLGRNEIESRRDIAFENYCNVIHIEALTLIEMLKRDVMPAISKYEGRLWRIAEHKASSVYKNFETKTAEKLAEYNDKLFSLCDKLQEAVEETAAMKDLSRSALSYHDNVLSLMDEIRTLCDKAQEITKREYWPYPAYGDMLFHV